MEGDWRKLKPTLGQAMSHSLQTGLYTDMTFKVGPTGYQVNVHKVILMLRSEVFAVMLQERWDGNSADSGRSVIDIPDASPDCFTRLITYFYTDELDAEISIPDCLEVLRLADMYQVPGLISKCLEFLESKISVDNCVQIYQGTRLYEELDLSQIVYNFLTKNIKAVVATEEFLHLDQQGLIQLLQSDNLGISEVHLFKAVMRWTDEWMDEVPPNVTERLTPRKEVLQSLIPLIRFPLMGAEAFVKEVVPTEVLNSDETVAILLHFNGTTEGLRFSAQPRRPPASTFKRMQCYADQEVVAIQQLELLPMTTDPHQFRFCCTKGITIQGLCVYGPDSSSRLFKSEYEIQYTISSAQYPFATWCQKELKIQVLGPGDFNILLDAPLDIQPNMDYSMNLKGTVKDLPVAERQQLSFLNSRFRIGKQPYDGYRGQSVVSVLEGRVGLFKITYPEPTRDQSSATCSYGMIQSILYTL